MTDDQKRIAIAEEDGWKWGTPWGKTQARFAAPKGYRSHTWTTRSDDNAIIWPLNSGTIEQLRIDLIDALPPYLTSRDAIVPAIVRRFGATKEKRTFGRVLSDLTGAEGSSVMSDWFFALATADPRVLADAYLAAASRKA